MFYPVQCCTPRVSVLFRVLFLPIVDVVVVVAHSGACQSCVFLMVPDLCVSFGVLACVAMVFLPINYVYRGVTLHDWVNDF